MVIIKVGETYADGDFSLLCRHLHLLDSELVKINGAIKGSTDPDSDGLFDAVEYFIGHGFVAIQRYLTSARTSAGLDQSEAFCFPPTVNSQLKFAEALNAGANYWKHSEEWFEALSQSENATLKGNALKTLEMVKKVTPWADYTCSNLLAVLGNENDLNLSSLLSGIAEWRDNLMKDF
jgi:hypothetical protein